MKKYPEDFMDEPLRERLSEFEADVNPSQWAAIQQTLDRKSRRPKAWFYLLALVIFSVMGIFFYKYIQSAKPVAHHKIADIQTDGAKIDRPNQVANKIPDNGSYAYLQKSIESKETKIFSKNQLITNIHNQKKYSGQKPTYANTKTDQTPNELLNSTKDKPMIHLPMSFIDIGLNQIYANEQEFKMPLLSSLPADNQINISHKSPTQFLSRFAVSMFLSPMYNTLKTIENKNDQSQIHEDYSGANSKNAVSGFGFSGGFRSAYNFTGNFYVHAGIAFTSLSQSVQYHYNINRIPVIDSATRKILGYIQLPSPEQINYSGINSYHYISIPLEISYGSHISTKLFWKIKAGADLMFLSGASGQIVRPDNLQLESLANNDDLSKTGLDFHVSAGLGCHLSKNFDLELLPQFHQWINSLYNTSSAINGTDWSAELEIGLKYKIQGKK